MGEKKPKFKVGDVVRIGKKKKTFEKGFTTNWTEELFTIIQVQPTNPWTYKIKDWKGEEVKELFTSRNCKNPSKQSSVWKRC